MKRPQPGPPRDYHFPKFKTISLENGLRAIIAPVAKLPVVTVLAVIDAPAVLDPSGKEGVAELTAQALREGTMGIEGAQLALEFEMLGTSVEAGADWDSTVLSMTVLRDRLDAAFSLFSRVVLSPAFRSEDIERLRAERLAERMQIIEEPRGLADESFSRFVYASDARYAVPMSGSSSSVSAITREDVVRFYEENYSAARTTVILAGDITADEGTRLVTEAFASWRSGAEPSGVDADRAARNSRATQIVSRPDAAQSELRIGHVGVPRMNDDYFSIVVMNAVLGGLFSSRINLNLREVHGYTYGASSYYDWRRQSGPFLISTAVQSDKTADAISEVLTEIDRMRAETITDEELTLATSYLEGVFPIRYETTSAIAAALANIVTFELPESYYDTYRSRITAVTTADVLEAARAYVHPDQLQVLVVGDRVLLDDPVAALEIGPMNVCDEVEI
jgi:zinc protease